MKKIVQFLLTVPIFLAALHTSSQELTGIWRGYFITEGGDQYKYEVQLDQSKKAGLSGVTYSYLDTRFYGKATFTGNYTRTANTALVQEIKTVELRMAGGSVACIMKCRLLYSRSGREEFLEGAYTSSYEKGDDLSGVRRGGDCGGGKVFLRKVVTSDFYVEPFLRNKKAPPTARKKDTVRTLTTKRPETRPITKQPVAKKTDQPKNETVAKKNIDKPGPIQTESTKKTEGLTANTKPVVVPKIPSVPVTLRDRKNDLIRTISVSSGEVEISLYDNGEIDDDTVSIYVNNALIIANKRLSNKPITYKLQVDEAKPEHTIVMVAENLGRIPPNTSLMIIHDGETRHQVTITSTEQKNAMVRFRYEKKQ